MLQLNIYSTWLPGLYPGIAEIPLPDISIQKVTSIFHVGIYCKLLFAKVLFTETKEMDHWAQDLDLRESG
jgi:hypothetical protein